ncbi:MAG: AMP-binding protein [Burkholderiaceae bacterium]
MYPAMQAARHPDKPAFIMAGSGEVVTYAELDKRSNRLAHLLRRHGLKRLDHYASFMENNSRCVEISAAAERSGLYITCVNSFLTAEELAYIVNNSESKVLITSRAKREVAMQAAPMCPNLELCLIVDGTGDDGPFLDYAQTLDAMPDTPIEDEVLGMPMLYSSGTTGRPKGILRPLPEQPPSQALPLHHFLIKLWHYREDMVYLSPAPLYHSAPQAAVALTIRCGATAVIMDKFDPETYLSLIEKYKVTHSQLVPTMFSRLLKLPDEVRQRYDVSSLEVAIHAAAPCPVGIKERMIAWWGPIIDEYYGASEGLGFTACNSAEWLAHKGSVGRVLLGDIHILDENMQPAPKGVPGEIWFKTANPFEYFNDPERTRLTRSPDGTMSTVGDVGYLDADNFLYLTDRSTFMIISGGVNVYPQEAEDLLISHRDVADAAVFGVPNEDLGEEVKAVVQLMPGVAADSATEQRLIAYCHEHLASIKCPRSIDFADALPRLPTGKLYKRKLRDKFWEGHKSRLL